MASNEIKFNVDIAIAKQTADLALNILNLYLKKHPEKRPKINYPDPVGEQTAISISIEDFPELLTKKMNIPEQDDDQKHKNEDPDTLPHWIPHYIDNITMLFSCSKCGFVDTVKRAACIFCGREMKID